MNELTIIKNCTTEIPDIVYGRLLESVHISGYSMERACTEFEWILEDDRWKVVGPGYDDIDAFLETISLAEFKITIEQRKKIVKRLSDIRATQRATAKVLGVGVATVNRDLDPVPSGTIPEAEDQQKQDVTEADVPSGTKPPPKNVHVAENSGENEWFTPPEYIEAATAVLGGKIDLDPASSILANKIVQAETFYTKENSGLDKHWSGSVWMNPPYASDLIKQFCAKFSFHVVQGNIKSGIVLVNNATETAWFRELIDCASAVVFTSGRVRFLDPQGNPGAPLQGQALIYFGEKARAFVFEFKKFGWGALLS